MIQNNPVNIINEIFSEVKNISARYNKIKNYYVYVTFFDDGYFYIGSRICECKPEEDVSYFGSYKNKNYFNPNKVIIKEFFDESEMIFCENSLIEKYLNNVYCINQNKVPRALSNHTSNNNVLIEGLIYTKELMSEYKCGPSTMSNWCRVAEIDRIKIGKKFYIKNEDKKQLDELNDYLKSGYGYIDYLKSKNKNFDETKKIISIVKGSFIKFPEN